MPKRLTYTIDDIGCVFSEHGYTIVDDEYKGIREYVRYKCPNGHSGKATPFDFKQGYGRCPCEASRKVWKEYNLLYKHPWVKERWDYVLNEPMNPQDFTPGSHKIVWWKCFRCSPGHSYRQSIRKFVGRSSECPYYLGRRVGYGNDLYSNYKDMCDLDWDWEFNEKLPSEYTPNSHRVVFWLCRQCNENHTYGMPISDKVRGRSCPYAAGKKVGHGNSVGYVFPEVAAEWDFDRNKKDPSDYCYGSHKSVWFVHETAKGDTHRWKAPIKNRTLAGTRCPYCAQGDVSGISQEWLDSLNIRYLEREYSVFVNNRRLKVDGFDPETNKVYEFLGDFWHGNSEIYDSEDINPVNRKTFGQLHQETYQRFRLLEGAGYRVVYIWEKDFLEQKKKSVV